MIFFLLLWGSLSLDSMDPDNYNHYKWQSESSFRSTASGPGTYAGYTWPSGHAGATSMRVNHIWATLPNSTEKHGNAVFGSTQQWYTGGPGGYMGTQAWRDKSGKMTYRALFSCWDADSTTKTGWLNEPDGHCERFGGEGVGSHCSIPYTLKQDNEYAVEVSFHGNNKTGAFWKGTITDKSSGVVTNIGTLYYPNYKGLIGYGNMQINAADFLEYFEADGCANQAIAGVGLIGPYLTLPDKTTIIPTQATGSYVSGCEYEDVTGSIPRHGSGSPRVFMKGGGTTRQTVKAGTPLW